MSRFAQLGLFAIVALALLFVSFFVITDMGGRRSGYRIGVHFAGASGLPPGARVLLSGVDVGSVERIRLLPNGSVDVIIVIARDVDIPKDATFGIQPSLTGSPAVTIAPPARHLRPGVLPTPYPPQALLARRVLPLGEQPTGMLPLSVETLMRRAIGLQTRSRAMFATLQARRPQLMASLQGGRGELSGTQTQLRTSFSELSATLDATSMKARAHIARTQRALSRVRDRGDLQALASSLESTSSSLKATASSLRSIQSDPRVRANMRASTAQLQQAMDNVRALKESTRVVTGDPQTRAQSAERRREPSGNHAASALAAGQTGKKKRAGERRA